MDPICVQFTSPPSLATKFTAAIFNAFKHHTHFTWWNPWLWKKPETLTDIQLGVQNEKNGVTINIQRSRETYQGSLPNIILLSLQITSATGHNIVQHVPVHFFSGQVLANDIKTIRAFEAIWSEIECCATHNPGNIAPARFIQ
ncbi:MAG: hypothetical protein NTW08_03655 [Gammaproteobacteria bacterium]|nr:hypothetical protein [Gammaproteobacteria bacterium]